ncbi:hypothetical protein B0T16DRAFT_204308 [Cercophora newfieldiana]|uniref:Uncharacterized protein n=1 Tax=Cercophora newfieldiana TaxID=92897 RepID=A0AA39XVB0_9PEZI|nr:hypothetical protein B0T16DRAFT_204308 [Cercophora newfieldiana]
MDTSGAKPEVPFAPFLAGLAAWSVLRLIGEGFVQHVNPEFFEDLKLDIRRRYDLYFGTWLGTIFKVVSLSACSMALFTTPPETDVLGFVRPLNTAEQWCWGCRAVIYVQEIPHIASIPELIIHHILSIAGMISVLAYGVPRRQMYLMWATLLSEFVANSRVILKFHNRLTPQMNWWFSLAMASTIIGFRVTGAVVALTWALQSGVGSSVLCFCVNTGAIALYTTYMLKMSWREISRARILVFDWIRPAHVVVADKWRISLFGIAMGIGFVCTELSALFLYEANGERSSSEEELHSLTWATLQAVVAGLLGSYVTAPIRRFAVSTSASQGQKNQPTRLCLQGGFLFAAAAFLLTPTLSNTIDKSVFLACMALSFPLLDTIDYIGCYVAGIAFAKTELQCVPTSQFPSIASEKSLRRADNNEPDRPTVEHIEIKGTEPSPSMSAMKTLVPLPLIASLVSAVLYLELLAVYLTDAMELQHAAAMALGVQAIIRYKITKLRGDVILTTVRFPFVRGDVSWASIWFWAQQLTTLFYLHHSIADIWSCIKVYLALATTSAALASAIFVLSKPVIRKAEYVGGSEKPASPEATKTNGGKHTGKIIAILTGTVLCLLLIAGAYFDGMPTPITSVEHVVHEEKAPSVLLNAASSWQFVLSTVGVALLPIAMVQWVD